MLSHLRPSRVLPIFGFLLLALALTLGIFIAQQPAGRLKAANNAGSALDNVVFQTLADESTNGWDPQYKGILINWRRDDTAKVNCSSATCDSRAHTTRHDSQNDLRDLENMYWYKYRHPGDTSQDQYIARLLPTVKSEWGSTTLDKGWVYFILLRLVQYSGDGPYWTATAQHWAAAQYATIDPALGIHHGPVVVSTAKNAPSLKDAYRVDHDLELGAALADAGTRFNHPAWVTAGLKEVNVVTQEAYSTQYHLFNRIYVISDPKVGSNKIYDFQAKMGEQAEELEALIRAGVYTHDAAFLSLAKQMLDALQSLPIHDTTNGGFFFKMYLGNDGAGHTAGQVDTGSKEARQLHLLESVHLANAVFGNRWAALEAELTGLAITPGKFFLPAPVPGFTYHQLPNWALYPCSSCSPQATENWDSAEADGIALESLQTVLSGSSGIVGAPTVNPTTPAPAPSATSTLGNTLTLLPVADTYVSAKSPSANFGSSTKLKVADNPSHIAYLKFDLSSLAGKHILSAKLRLYITNGSHSTEYVKLVPDGSWNELTLTYKNDKYPLTTLIATIPPTTSGKWVEVDITPALAANAGNILSIGIGSSSKGGIQFYSREASQDQPELVIEL